MNIGKYFLSLAVLVSIISLMQAMEDPKEDQPSQLESMRENMRASLRQGFNIEHIFGEGDEAITPLMRAVLDLDDSEQVNRVRVLLEYGADAQARTSDGDTSLHMVASEDHDDVDDWGITINNAERVLRNYEIIGLLTDHGANIERLNDHNETPLMKATQQRRLDAIKSLLLHGASTKWIWSWRNKLDNQLSLQEKAGKAIMESLESSCRSRTSIIDFNIYQCLMNPTFGQKSNDYMSETLFEEKQWIQEETGNKARSQLSAEKGSSIFNIIKNREFGGKKYQDMTRKRKQDDRDEEVEVNDTREIKRRKLNAED